MNNNVDMTPDIVELDGVTVYFYNLTQLEVIKNRNFIYRPIMNGAGRNPYLPSGTKDVMRARHGID